MRVIVGLLLLLSLSHKTNSFGFDKNDPINEEDTPQFISAADLPPQPEEKGTAEDTPLFISAADLPPQPEGKGTADLPVGVSSSVKVTSGVRKPTFTIGLTKAEGNSRKRTSVGDRIRSSVKVTSGVRQPTFRIELTKAEGRSGTGTSALDSKCKNGDYSCTDGKCIPQDFVCDGVYDCTDGKDEETCREVVRPAFDYPVEPEAPTFNLEFGEKRKRKSGEKI